MKSNSRGQSLVIYGDVNLGHHEIGDVDERSRGDLQSALGA